MPPRPVAEEIVRASIIEGLVGCVATRGYASVTINDIVEAAHVSKSTFYAQFEGKEDCFLKSYEVAAETLLNLIVEAADQDDLPYDELVLAATTAYMERIAADVATARTFMLEVLAAGPDALRMRHEVNQRFAAVLRRLVDESDDPRIHPLSASAALLVVGGANELVLSAIVEDRLDELPALAPTVASALLAAVTSNVS